MRLPARVGMTARVPEENYASALLTENATGTLTPFAPTIVAENVVSEAGQ